MYSKFSVVLPFYGSARHSMMKYVSVEYCSQFFRQRHTGHVQKQVIGEVSMTARAVISGWFPYLPTRYMLRKTRRNLRFDSLTLADPPPARDLTAPSYHSLLLQSHTPAVAYKRSLPSSIIARWNALYQAG